MKAQFINEFLEILSKGSYTFADLVFKGVIGDKEIERTLVCHKFKSMRKHSTYEVAVYNCSVYFGVSEGKIKYILAEGKAIEL